MLRTCTINVSVRYVLILEMLMRTKADPRAINISELGRKMKGDWMKTTNVGVVIDNLKNSVM